MRRRDACNVSLAANEIIGIGKRFEESDFALGPFAIVFASCSFAEPLRESSTSNRIKLSRKLIRLIL